MGFVPVSKKTKLSSVFVAGIRINDNDVNHTIQCIHTYLENNNCRRKYIRKIKETGVTVSVKIDINQGDADKLVADDFWPDGIYSRYWID